MATLHLIDSKPITPVLGLAQSVAFHPSGKLLAVANTMEPPQSDADGKISLFGIDLTGPISGWHLETPHVISTGACGAVGGISGGLAFSKGGDLLALANGYTGDGDIGCVSLFFRSPAGWAPVPGSPFSFESIHLTRDSGFEGALFLPNALAFAPWETNTGNVVSTRLAIAGDPNFVWLFDADATGLTPFGNPHSTKANPIDSSPGATGVAFNRPRATPEEWYVPPVLLATSNSDASTSLFVVEPSLEMVTGSPFPTGGQPPPQGNNLPLAIAFSTLGDIDLIAVAIDGSGVALLVPSLGGTPALSPAPASPFATGSTGGTNSVAFSADGKILAATNVEGPIDAQTGSVSLFGVKEQPFGLELATGSPFRVGPTPANAVAFSPVDNRIFAVASGNGGSNNGSVSLFLIE